MFVQEVLIKKSRMAKGVLEGKKAREYERLYGHLRDKEFDNFILKNVGKGKRVCDLCCGTGYILDLLKNKVKEVVGIDMATEMVKICNEKFKKNKKVKAKVGSATNTKLKPNSFDYVTIKMGLHHIKDKEGVMKEAHRILKKGGKIIIIDKSYVNLFEMYWKALRKFITKGVIISINEYLLSKEKNEEIIEEKYKDKFKIVKKKNLPPDKEHSGQVFMYVLEKNG